MDEGARKTLSTIAALVFLGLVGALLARPVFDADRGSDAPAVLPEPTRKERQESSPSPRPTPSVETIETGGLARPFPRSCLTKFLPEPGMGRLAVASFGRPGTKNKVTIASVGGGQSFTFAASAPLEWSPSGGFLATRGPELWSAQGDRLPASPKAQDAPWAWSPIADCLVTWDVRTDELVLLEPAADQKTVLLTGGRQGSLRFSTRGRHLMVGKKVYDVASGELVKNAPVSALGLGKPREFAYESYCTELGPQFAHETCSWNEQLVAFVRDGRLSIGPVDGGTYQPMTTDSGYRDAWPTWGPRRTGIVFVRVPDGGGPAEIWFIPEGGRAQTTGLRTVDVRPPGGDWSIYLDWTLDRPLGMTHPVPGR